MMYSSVSISYVFLLAGTGDIFRPTVWDSLDTAVAAQACCGEAEARLSDRARAARPFLRIFFIVVLFFVKSLTLFR